jgi:hypothetical protein
MDTNNEISEIVETAKQLAKRYKEITGKPLGITGEIAEFCAAKLLDLELAHARQKGYDAIRVENGKIIKIQIKGRCLPLGKKSARLGHIRLDAEWDIVLFLHLDENYDVVGIYEANRCDVEDALRQPGSRARERGSLSVNKFKSIARKVWPVDKQT